MAGFTRHLTRSLCGATVCCAVLTPVWLLGWTLASSDQLDMRIFPTVLASLRDEVVDVSEALQDVVEGDGLQVVERAVGLVVLMESGLLEAAPVADEGSAPCPREAVALARRFVRYATASYGWALVNALFLPGTAAIGDNLVASVYDKAALNARLVSEHTGSREGLLLAQWESSPFPYLPAHFVAVDRTTQSLVVAIRGTLHPLDVLADLRARARTVRRVPGGESTGGAMRAHEGMAQAAVNLRASLEPRLHDWLARGDLQGFGVVVVGHSLGGGAAALLAVGLREALPGTTVRAFTFAPPATMDLSSARGTAAFVFSFVAGADLVPSLDIPSLKALADRTRAAFHLARRELGADAEALVDSLRTTVARLHNRSTAAAGDERVGEDALATNREKMASPSFQESLRQASQQATGTASEQQLFPAGQVCWLREASGATGCAASLVHNDAFALRGVMLSRRALADHLPSHYEQVLGLCAAHP